MLIAVNEAGRRIGQYHHNARISDDTVTHIRDLREYEGKTYEEISKITGIRKSTVQKICLYERRAQYADRWKKIEQDIPEDQP